MISFGSCIYPTLGSAKVSPSRVASPENYKHQTLKVSGVTPRPELPPITLPPTLLRAMELAQEKGSSSWLSALPLEQYGLTLHKGAFRDALALRYGWTPANLPILIVPVV